MRANTIEQYHILKWIEQRFIVEHIKIELLNRYNVKITDINKDTTIITYNKDRSISIK